jgi:hypothetical protein
MDKYACGEPWTQDQADDPYKAAGRQCHVVNVTVEGGQNLYCNEQCVAYCGGYWSKQGDNYMCHRPTSTENTAYIPNFHGGQGLSMFRGE